MNKEKIKKERLKLGYTQKELGEKIGVSRGTISNYESGETIPDENKSRLLNAVFSTKKEVETKEPSLGNERLLTDDEKMIISNAFLLSEKQVLEIPVVQLWLKYNNLEVENNIMRQISEAQDKKA